MERKQDFGSVRTLHPEAGVAGDVLVVGNGADDHTLGRTDRPAGEIFAVLAAALCDIALEVILDSSGIKLPFEVTAFITPVVLLWYILTEVGSIIENCGRMGAKVPSWFKQRVDNAKDAIDHDQGGDSTDVPQIEGDPVEVGKHEKEYPPDGDQDEY